MTNKSNDWIEYKRLIISEFKHINENIEKLSESRELDAEKVRKELRDTVALSEERIVSRINGMEKRQSENLKKLEIAVDSNTREIVELKIKAALFGALSGSGVAGLIQIITILLSK